MNLDQSVIDQLKIEVLKARRLSYSPYSKFQVGCCILTNDLRYIHGANVENASYGATLCAERCAIMKAITSSNKKDRSWKCMAIIGGPKEGKVSGSYISPCGICRQSIREFAPPSFPIIMFNSDVSSFKMLTLDELLPMSFGPNDLQPKLLPIQ